MTAASAPWPERPELAELYDVECAGRWDHDFYLDLAVELGAGSLVDIGCGTGVFAVDAAARGLRVVGVDPAEAVLDIARHRVGGHTVDWVHGDLTALPADGTQLAIMMGHVAQYFLADDEWADVLAQIHRVLLPGGHLAFETRNPAIDWAGRWTREATTATYAHPLGGRFTSWVEAREVAGPAHSYTMTHDGHTVLSDGRHLVASETLRFRSPAEILTSLDASGFAAEHTWGDWRRSPFEPTSEELIVLARS